MAYTTINKPQDHQETTLYTGDGNSTKAITGVGFQPDWVWIKNRTDAHWHNVTDVIRGTSKTLRANTTAAQASNSSSGYVSAFGSDGFTVTAGSSDAEEVNTNTDTYVSWNWKGGGSGSANTDGSISSTVSANTTAGFSMVKFNTSTGSSNSTETVGHGLNSAPEMMILKPYTTTDKWFTYHEGIGNAKYLQLQDTNSSTSNSNVWASTDPTSSVFSIGTAFWGVNSNDIISYCFHSVTGYSKVGDYTGNGNSNGAFIYTGFRPGFILVKAQGVAVDWYIFDYKRNGINTDAIATANRSLRASAGDTEASASGYYLDILSNGFKIRTSNQALNTSGEQYVYYAVAEAPLVGSNNVPANAR